MLNLLKWSLFLGLLAFGTALWAQAQTPPPSPLMGSRVGVYVSKKNLQFGTSLTMPLASYLDADDSLGLNEEDLKLALTIRLGNALTLALRTDLGADSAFFVNADPTVARTFIQNHGSAAQYAPRLAASAPRGTHFVLLVDSLTMRTETRRSYFTVSNHIVSERREVVVARLHISILDVTAGRFLVQTGVTLDGDHPYTGPDYLHIVHPEAEAARFLNDLFNLALGKLLEGI